jgi:predicted RNase H-like HicB family nuclease
MIRPQVNLGVIWLSGIATNPYLSFRTFVVGVTVRSYTAVVERDTETGVLVGHIPGFRGAHSQGTTMEELEANLAEVVAMLLEDGEPHLEAEFVGTQTVRVA